MAKTTVYDFGETGTVEDKKKIIKITTTQDVTSVESVTVEQLQNQMSNIDTQITNLQAKKQEISDKIDAIVDDLDLTIE